MGASGHTTNYNLPTYVGTDIFDPMTDWNTAMGIIDTEMKRLSDAVSAINLANFIKYDATNGTGLTCNEYNKLMKHTNA